MGSLSTSELIGEPLINNLTVHEILANAALKNPSAIALACLHQDPDYLSSLSGNNNNFSESPHLRWTFYQLLLASHRVAIALAAHGIRPGQLIAAYVTSGVEFHIIVRAALELGCPFAPLNPRTASNKKETGHFFEILKPTVVVVLDENTARSLDETVPEELEKESILVVCDGIGSSNGRWQDLCDFVEGADKNFVLETFQRKMDDVAFVAFTSGTTSLPKGVPHTNESWSTMLLASGLAYEVTPSRIVCCTPPLFAALGVHFSLFYHAVGARVVHSSAWFDAGACLAAIHSERVTDLPGVPAMISALVGHPDLQKRDTSCLQYITLGATTVLPEHLRMCTEVLKARKVINTFGMTENGASFIGTPEQVPRGSFPPKGYMIRVCDPDTDEVLPRGVKGELHIGGTAVVQTYWTSKTQDAEKANSCFYEDRYGYWMKTGDQAVIAENSHISVVGRYKDMIIRGGANIAPSAIESVLTEEFGLIAEVVGIPDDVAGEVPVAVIKSAATLNIQEVQEAVLRRLGKSFILEEIVLLSNLGKSDFPKNAAGKVKKDELRDLVIDYLKNRHIETPGSDELITMLTRLWKNVLGIGSITPQTSIHDYADSLVLARFSAKLSKLGHSLNLQQLLNNPTIEDQAKLLSSESHNVPNEDDNSKLLPQSDGPLQIENVLYAMGNSSKFDTTKDLCQEVLKPLNLTWDDVESVFPMYDQMQRLLKRWRPQGNNIRQTWLCRGKSTSEVSAKLKESLKNHPILRSMVIKQDRDILHVVLRPTDAFFSQSIQIAASVPDRRALVEFEYDNLEVDFAADPGPVMRIFVMDIEEENCAGFVCIGQHSVFDITSMYLWLEDLDMLLNEPKMRLKQHVPYQIWAEHHYNLHHSEMAQASIAWNAKRLTGISEHKEALFPRARVPGWFKGNTEGWIDIDTGALGQVRRLLDGFDGVKGIFRTITLRDTAELKSKFGVEIPQILKAALAIVNTRHTGSEVTLFGQSQAGRSWPFIPEWQASRMPDAMRINGPTLQVVALNVLVRQKDSVLSLLQALQMKQADINKHCHAPYYDLMAKLNKEGKSEGDMMEEILRRQIFNWIPAGPNEYKTLEQTSTVSRANIGLHWNCRMLKHGEIVVNATWDGAQLMKVEVEALLKKFDKVSEQLAKQENWEKNIEEL